jgi:glycosyltransferase involved in cell wall biosynthesis
MNLPKVVIITATTGSKYLDKCIKSVQNQTYNNIKHIIVCDGNNFKNDTEDILKNYDKPNYPIDLMVIPWNSGADKYICHKIYAAVPHLINEKCYICYLDEDNYFEHNHVESLMNTIIQNKCTWAYSLRNIINKNDEFICRDLCESLGNIRSTWISKTHSPDYLVDTSCYMVPIEIIREFSNCWQRPARVHPEADRLFYECLSKKYRLFKCSMEFSLNYRVEGRPDSVKADFFLMGNGMLKRKMQLDKLPWDKE